MKNLNERKISAGISVESLILFTIAIVIVGVVVALIGIQYQNWLDYKMILEYSNGM